jgi:predicted dinucleotide-binding enzyme
MEGHHRMSAAEPVIGILGAGRFGSVLARLASSAGYRVLIAGSGDPRRIALPRDVVAQGAVATTAAAVVTQADIVVLALPLGSYRTIPADQLTGKIVIDAMNYWWTADGILAEFTDPLRSSSEVVQSHLSGSRVVKAFNHMGYADLEDEARPPGQPDRKAIGVAADDPEDLDVVAGIVDRLGFDPVRVGRLADGVTLEPGTEPFGADVDAAELQAMIDRFPTSQRGLRRAAALAARTSPGSDR